MALLETIAVVLIIPAAALAAILFLERRAHHDH